MGEGTGGGEGGGGKGYGEIPAMYANISPS